MLKHSLTWTQMDIASLLGLLAKVVIIIPLDYAMDTLSSTVDLEPTIWSVCLPNFYLILGQSAHFCWSSLLWAHVVFFPQTWSPTKTTIVWAIRSAQFREPTIAGGCISPFTSKEENAAAIVVNDVVQRNPEGSSSLGCRKWMKMNRTSLPNMENLACCTHANWKDATSGSCSRFRHLFGIGSTWLYHQNWMVPVDSGRFLSQTPPLRWNLAFFPLQQRGSGGWTYSGVYGNMEIPGFTVGGLPSPKIEQFPQTIKQDDGNPSFLMGKSS